MINFIIGPLKRIFKKNKKDEITAGKIEKIKDILLENTDKIKDENLFSILLGLVKQNKKVGLPGFSPYLAEKDLEKKYDTNLINTLKLKNYGNFSGNNVLFSFLGKIVNFNKLKSLFFNKTLILILGIIGLVSLHLGINVYVSYIKTNKEAIQKLKRETKKKELFEIKKELLIEEYGRNWELKYLYLFNTLLVSFLFLFQLKKNFKLNNFVGAGNYLTFSIFTNIVIEILDKSYKDTDGKLEIYYFDIKQILFKILTNFYKEGYLTHKDFVLLFYNLDNYNGKKYKDLKLIISNLKSLQTKGEIYGFKGILEEILTTYYEKISLIEARMEKLKEQYNNIPLYVSTFFFIAINVYSITLTMEVM